MIGFHIDMNIAQFTREYLEKWLAQLAALGYDTIIWEVENNVAWETCPECASPDAFSKDEFRELLAVCRKSGLEPVPLFQTIAHCEYVLKHDKYKHLAEIRGEIKQYCPRNPNLVPFLHRWIDEYLELFGEIKFFHLGADEAWWMGSCDKCAAFVAKHSLSRLFIDHVSAVCRPLLEHGVTPVIWADMALHHDEAIDKLSRDIMLFDWLYDRRNGMGKFYVWGGGWARDESVPPHVIDKFGKYLFPLGDEPGRAADPFYTSDYLAAGGFRVVVCPGSSSYGDNVFSPRNWYHMANTYDSCRKGFSAGLEGAVLTSWTVHLHPWELQRAAIGIPPFVAANPSASIEEYQRDFLGQTFGCDDGAFWRACGLLSKSCLFTHTDSLGYDKAGLAVPISHAAEAVGEIRQGKRLEQELANARARLGEYREGLELMREFGKKATRGAELIDSWLLAARNLVNRARASTALLSAPAGERAEVADILDEMRALRDETDRFYAPVIKPARRGEMMDWLFASVRAELERLAAGLPGP